MGPEVDDENDSVTGGVRGCLRLTQGVNRTAVHWSVRTLVLVVTAVLSVSLVLVGSSGFDGPRAFASVPVDEPVTTANDFLPEERDVTDCIGVLERPGCGSESRGGWRQTAILGAIFIGLGIVFGNVVRGVRKNRQ